MRIARVAGLAALALLAAGCVMPDKVSEMQKDLADIRAEIRAVQQSQDEAIERLQALEATASDRGDLVTKADLADVAVSIDQMSRDVAIVDERLNDMGRRMDRLSQQVQQAREMSQSAALLGTVPSGGPAGDSPVDVAGGGSGQDVTVAGGAGTLPDPNQLYNTAYADFSKGNYALAISGFEEYQEKFPGTALADNALYWIGECHFSQGNFSEAVKAFDSLLEIYPRSDKAAASNLKKGLAYLDQRWAGRSCSCAS